MHNSVAPLLILGLILIVGLVFGMLAKKLHLPSVSGQILAGIALGALGIPFLSVEHLHDMRPVTDFALGLIAVTVGSHLNFSRLRNAYRRLLTMVLLEIVLTPLLVFAAVRLLGQEDWTISLLFAFLAVSTAPATVVALVKETRSKGVFVKTLLGAVALNNMVCIAVFEFAHVIVSQKLGGVQSTDLMAVFWPPIRALVFSAGLGLAVGLIAILASRKIISKDKLASISMIAILLTSGLAESLGLSALLSSLFLGMAFANLAPDKDEVGHGVFSIFEHGIYAVFFTMAGMELELRYIVIGGELALLAVAARAVGKVASGWIAMRFSGATERTQKFLGPALIPQSGIAVGHILLIQSDPTMASVAQIFLAAGITTVAINESFGPILTRLALKKAGAVSQDRPRVLDFIHEQNISTNFYAESKNEAIDKLATLLWRLHKPKGERAKFVQAVIEAEDEASTCLGHGLAVPHAICAGSADLIGVMGISSKGLPFMGPDGQPVHCMVLLASPLEQRDRHHQVLAALAGVFTSDRLLREQLFQAQSPAHVYEILHVDDGSEAYNDFLLDDAALSETSQK